MKNSPRFTPPRLRDPRVLIGFFLVIASLVGTWFVVTRFVNTITVWAANTPLVSGTTIAQDSVSPVEVRLPEGNLKYIPTSENSPIGMTVTSPVAAGELIPASVLTDPESLTGRVVALDITGSLPGNVQSGARIDVWATSVTDDEVTPEEVLTGVYVNSVSRDEGGFTSSTDTRLEVYVPADKIDRVLEVIAGEDRISVVAYPGGEA